jgi:hypothetical protein
VPDAPEMWECFGCKRRWRLAMAEHWDRPEGLCPSCARAVGHGLVALDLPVPASIVGLFLDDIAAREEDLQVEAREAGREIRDLQADLRDAEARAEEARY